ncbi:MAG: MBL fold metallo-hydrolase [Anaerostipes sp.]|jgi:L-ascorbate metabolism protein UlaG (beta-lactamase superfamily)|nr:MBL fold metallo-hydrolase [Anaerostipes sp.]MDD3747370.1 MBL fold metallo-hydrolase [Anaerostipes sp.]
MKITFMEHSGFLVEMDSCILMFDYYQGEIPKVSVNKPFYVFASHAHHDHFNQEILKLEQDYPKIQYILSDDIKVRDGDNRNFIGAHETLTLGDMKVETLLSTDEGVAFFVTVEGKNIYHAGDLNWWHWNGEPEEDNAYMEKTYKEELDIIKGRHIDVAFVLLDPRQEDKYCLGMNYFMEEVGADMVFPMHAFGTYKISKHYLNCQDGRAYQGIVQEITGPGQCFEIK